MEAVEAELHGWARRALRDEGGDRRELPPHAGIRLPAGERRRGARRRRQPQSVRCRARAGAARGARRARRGRRSRCSKAWPITRRARCATRPAALLLYAPVVHDSGFRQRARLSHPAARRKHRAGEFSAAICSPSRPAARRGSGRRRAFSDGWERTPARRPRIPPRGRCPRAGRMRFDNEPDTDWTQLANRDALWRAIDAFRPAEPPAELDAAGISRRRSPRAQRAQPALGSARRRRRAPRFCTAAAT